MKKKKRQQLMFVAAFSGLEIIVVAWTSLQSRHYSSPSKKDGGTVFTFATVFGYLPLSLSMPISDDY